MVQFYYIYIKAPVDAVNDDDLPDPIFRTLCRLLITAREFRYRRTPQMTIHEMARVAGLKERAMWNHLSVLRESAHVSVESPRRGHYVIHFPAFTAESAQLCSGHVVVDSHDPLDLDQHQQISVHGGGVGGEPFSARPCTEEGAESANLCTAKACTESQFIVRKLAEMHILEPTRSELVGYPWVTDDYAAAWALWAAAHPEAGPGVIVANMRRAVEAPEVTPAELAAVDPLRAGEESRRRYLERLDELGIMY